MARWREWWAAYLASPPPDLPGSGSIPSWTLSVPLGAHRLVAKFDLVAIDPGRRAVIVDWKTSREAGGKAGSRAGCRRGCTATCWRRPART